MGYPKTIYVQHVTAPFFGRAFEDRPAGYAVRYDMHDDEAHAEIARLQAEVDGLRAEIADLERLGRRADRKPLLDRFSMRNGHAAQRPDEDRADYNLRVHGLREEDFE